MPDLLIAIGAAILANVVLLGVIGWYLMRARGKSKARAGTAAAAAARPAEAAPKPRRGIRRTLWAMIDGSVGMYLFRRALGRPTTVRSQDSQDPLAYLDEDVVASRIGAASALGPTGPAAPVAPAGPVVLRPTRLVVAGSPVAPMAAASASTAAAAAASPPPKTPVPVNDRGRLYRDTFIAVAGFAVVLLFAAAMLPGYFNKPAGGVLGESFTPDSSVGIVITAPPTPTQVAVAATASPTPSPSATPAPSTAPAVTPGPTQTPTLVPTETQKPRFTQAPPPTPTPTPVPTPTKTPTPAPTASPTPTPTPVPLTLASFTCTANGDTLTCDASLSENATSWAWEFLNDGGTDSGVVVSHQYTNSGTKTVRLTVDGPGGPDSDTNQYTVTVP